MTNIQSWLVSAPDNPFWRYVFDFNHEMKSWTKITQMRDIRGDWVTRWTTTGTGVAICAERLGLTVSISANSC